jgi:serine protease Do
MKRLSLILACLLLSGGAGTYLGRSLLQGQVALPPVVPKELTSYRNIVRQALPAVVSIEAQSSRGVHPGRRPGDMQLPGDFLPPFGPRGVDDEGPNRIGFGSGFLISPRGVIVTNNHVVANADQVLVKLLDGRKFTSKDIKTDPKADLAIVKIDPKVALPSLEWGNSSDMEIGDRVLAAGAPFGLDGTVTHGIISAKGRALRLNMYEDFLQTDAAINPGNSGGPLLNLEGKVIGINSAIKSRTGGFQGIGLAITSNLAKSIADQLLKNGVVRRGYLGVAIEDVTEELAKELGLKEAGGVRVTRLFPKAPGAKAGLKNGDVIVRLGGKPVKDGRELMTVVAGLPLGKPVNLQVLRDGKSLVLKVTIEEQPKDFGTTRTPTEPRIPEESRVTIDSVGMELCDLTEDLADALGYKATARGALVTRVERRGVAGLAGVRPGVLITRVNGKAVTSARAAASALRSASLEKGVRLELQTATGSKRSVLLKDSE